MVPPTLYSICFDYIKNHTEDITCLDGIPFSPTVEDILDYLFTSKVTLNRSILPVIAKSHSKELRKANSRWTSIHLREASVTSAIPSLQFIAVSFPQFVTCLNASFCNLYDEDLLLLRGFSNLRALDLSGNVQLTDKGVMSLENIVTSVITGGMPYLDKLELCQLRQVTDKSLKHIAKIVSLFYLDLSGTSITKEVAMHFLRTKGYTVVTNYLLLPSGYISNPAKENLKLQLFIKRLSFDYSFDRQHRPQPLSNDHNTFNPVQQQLRFKREGRNHAAGETRPLKKLPVKSLSPPVVKKRKTTTDYFKMVQEELLEDSL